MTSSANPWLTLGSPPRHHADPGPPVDVDSPPSPVDVDPDPIPAVDVEIAAPVEVDPGPTPARVDLDAAQSVVLVDEDVIPPVTGPLTPQPSVPVPDSIDRLPRRDVDTTAVVWVVGVHGGAGESTLAQLLEGSRAAEHAWPQSCAGGSLPVVLVARSSWRGLTAAQRAATDWASGTVPGVTLLGLVLLADAPGALPRPLGQLAKLVAGGVPRVWQLPWVEGWRLTEDPTTVPLPRAARRALDAVRALAANAPAAPSAVGAQP